MSCGERWSHARRLPTHVRVDEESRHMVRKSIVGLMLIALLCVAPRSASAQAAGGIAGVVRDTSGAVMPGVTVEASSPALIEKVRSVITDSEGQYKIIDLRPGTYTV